ncbi:MAG: hypothetical protein D5R98_03245 [Desulfonatronovibrio sp. MSAO_Bac4]|nr:MAG: hypothetical protein D5R98_03245 [Desulfonatronovibrio sp. MSAO_Bac4]
MVKPPLVPRLQPGDVLLLRLQPPLQKVAGATKKRDVPRLEPGNKSKYTDICKCLILLLI